MSASVSEMPTLPSSASLPKTQNKDPIPKSVSGPLPKSVSGPLPKASHSEQRGKNIALLPLQSMSLAAAIAGTRSNASTATPSPTPSNQPPTRNSGRTAGLHKGFETRIYRLRWLILAIFVTYSMSNAFQWIQYSIITNIIMRYYNVSAGMVNWTSLIYMITYVPLVLPGSWILNKWGLRTACLIGSAGTCLGAWVKVGSIDRDSFLITFIGQTIVACSQVFILSIPPRLAAVWFGADQVSSACSIGVFGNQLGVALGFLLPPMMVRNHEDVTLIGKDLRTMYFAVAVFSTIVFFAILTLFKSAPKLPPSTAQAVQAHRGRHFKASLRHLTGHRSYMLLLVSYGIMVGVFYAISTLLNQIILDYFPNQEVDAGRIGLTIVVAGMMGSVIFGIILDKTHEFKRITMVLYILALASLLAYTFTLSFGKIWIVYVANGLLGFFMTGYLPVGFEFAAELTYPEPEGTSSGLLNAASQIFGILFTILYGSLFLKYGDIVANSVLSVALVAGVFLSMMIQEDLRRQDAKRHTPRRRRR